METRSLPLAEKTQGQPNRARASFIICDSKVIGAYLGLEGYVGGPVPINDRRYFRPAGLTPLRLRFTGVSEVKLLGPWAKGGWRSEKVLSGRAQTGRYLAMLSSSRPRIGERSGTIRDEEYMMVLTYADGAQVRTRLTTVKGSGETFLTFDTDGLYGWHFLPPPEFKAYVISTLASKARTGR